MVRKKISKINDIEYTLAFNMSTHNFEVGYCKHNKTKKRGYL